MIRHRLGDKENVILTMANRMVDRLSPGLPEYIKNTVS